MRKITEVAALAFDKDKAFRRGSTEVIVTALTTRLLLHGHTIATRFRKSGNVLFTLAGWGTLTTRERVNGLLSVLGYPTRVIQSNRRHFLFHQGLSQPIGVADEWFINKDYEIEVL